MYMWMCHGRSVGGFRKYILRSYSCSPLPGRCHFFSCRSRCWCVYMGWLRLVGFLKLCVSFAEYSLFYRALLQKRPIISRSLPIVATPYHVEDGNVSCSHVWHGACFPTSTCGCVLASDMPPSVWHMTHVCVYQCVTYDSCVCLSMCDICLIICFICVTYVSNSTCECVHVLACDMPNVNESSHTCEWIQSHMRMSQVTHMHESSHTHAWVMSHMRMIQVTPVNVSIFSRVTCHMMILAWDMSHSHVCSDPPTCVKCLIRIPWLVHTCALMHSHVSFIY